jgi:hypothetical protein
MSLNRLELTQTFISSPIEKMSRQRPLQPWQLPLWSNTFDEKEKFMSIQSIHYVQQCTFLESGKQIIEWDLHFHSTGEFSLIKTDKDCIPEMINGVLPADKFFEFNNLINREVFDAKMPELFGKNVITPRTKRLETVYLQRSYENETETEETELLYDINPFNSPVSPEKSMLSKMLCDMNFFILEELNSCKVK